MSMDALASFLEYGVNLKKIKFQVGTLTGDLNGLERALFYAKNRVNVKIYVCRDKNNDIPVEALDENREWIDIFYGPMKEVALFSPRRPWHGQENWFYNN